MTALSLTETDAGTIARRIIVARIAGFCVGVRRAIQLTERARRNTPGALTTLGPIVHNNQVIDRMRATGIETATNLADIATGTVVLSAHGVATSVVQQAQDQGLGILNVTCPFVTKVHKSAAMLHEQGYQVVLVGDHGHTEVRGVVGTIEALGGTVSVVSTADEVRSLRLSKRVGVVCQTTHYSETFASIVAEICKLSPDVRAMNTVCGATDELQNAAVELARQVDVVIVVGGRGSANTRRLHELCSNEGVPAYHIETATEIEEAWLAGKELIGLTAGASTPDWIIEDVARALNHGKLPDDWRLQHPDE